MMRVMQHLYRNVVAYTATEMHFKNKKSVCASISPACRVLLLITSCVFLNLTSSGLDVFIWINSNQC